MAVNNVLYQTNGYSLKEIARPKTPVNPHKNTAKCILSNAFFIIKNKNEEKNTINNIFLNKMITFALL